MVPFTPSNYNLRSVVGSFHSRFRLRQVPSYACMAVFFKTLQYMMYNTSALYYTSSNNPIMEIMILTNLLSFTPASIKVYFSMVEISVHLLSCFNAISNFVRLP
jgi:hypothetical protein